MDSVENNIELETLKTLQNDWSAHYRALIEFGREFGHCNVPRTSTFRCTLVGICADGGDYNYTGSLGNWLHRQRKAKKKTGDLKIAPARESLLQKLADEGKFLWSPNDLNSRSVSSNKRKFSRSSDKSTESSADSVNIQNGHNNETDWNIHYAALVEYSKEYGHCNVPVDETYQCILVGLGKNCENYHYQGKLGNWLNTQKQAKVSQGLFKITKERENLLQQLVDSGKLHWGICIIPSGMETFTSDTSQLFEHLLPPLKIQHILPNQPFSSLVSSNSSSVDSYDQDVVSCISNVNVNNTNNYMQTAINVGYNIETAMMIQNNYNAHGCNTAAIKAVQDNNVGFNNVYNNALNMESNMETAMAMQNNNNMQIALNMGYKIEMDMLMQKNKEIAIQNEMNYLVYLIDTNL